MKRVLLAAGLLLALSASAVAQVTLRVGDQKGNARAVMEAAGVLKDVPYTIEWKEFVAAAPLLEALGAGAIETGLVGDAPFTFAVASGVPVKAIAAIRQTQEGLAMLVPESSTIKSFDELKGKKIAVTKGAGSHYLLLAALAKAGLTFKDITPAYLPPADGRTAFVSNNVEAWVAWDPFLSSTIRQSGARVLADGSEGLASYKRYYLASADYAAKHGDALNVIYGKLVEAGKWVKANPAAAASQLAALWGIDAATVEEANSHRSYQVGAVTAAGLTEQQKIADAFLAERVLPAKLDTSALAIWTPKAP